MCEFLRALSRSSLILMLLFFALQVRGETSLNANIFSHLEFYDNSEVDVDDNFSWGETALFLTGSLPNKWSFLFEGTYQAPKYRDDTFTVERIRVRYELNEDTWLSAGKMHTPVNYWNDNYHHGRLFFPVINRPLAFNRFIPIHEAGIRLGGQRLFDLPVGFDFVLGTGQSAGDDFFSEGVQSYTATLAWSLDSQSKIMVSYYRDTILDHYGDPNHGTHGFDPMASLLRHATVSAEPIAHAEPKPFHTEGPTKDIDYELFSFSAFVDRGHWTALTELSFNSTDGGSTNEAIFQYLGYHFSEHLTLYALFDMVNVNGADVHFERGREARAGVGFEYSFSPNVSLKVEARRRDDHRGGLDLYSNELQAQLAVGF